MKIINYINQSLTRKVIVLVGVWFTVFALGCGLLFFLQQQAHDEYIQQRGFIKEKQQLIYTIYNEFNTDFLILPESIVFKVPMSNEEALNKESKVTQNLNKLNQLIEKEDERLIYQEMNDFITNYFNVSLPLAMKQYEKNENYSITLQNSTISFRAEKFLKQNQLYIDLLEGQLTKTENVFSERQLWIQNAVITFFILVCIISLIVIRRLMNRIGKPLANFTDAANEIASGKEATIIIDENRKDELGVLSVAFKKMMSSIQDKEQNLVAHNEELIAQQDELQAQQEELIAQQLELQEALDILKDNDQRLMRWNRLVSCISTSLNKTEVLQSIIENMCKITKSDKGILSSFQSDAYSSFGISEFGVKQFRDHIDNGFIQRLQNDMKPITVKRLQHPMEKGYHENDNYSFDLYLPIIFSEQLAGVMVLSRFGDAYSESELSEYETLVKQIAIHLEKVKLFEQSENSRRLNQDILSTVQEGIQLIGTEGNIIQVNQHLYKMFKCKTIDEILGLPWEQWSQIMAEQIKDQTFIQTLENSIQASLISPNEEHSFIYRKKDSNEVFRVYCKTINYLDEHIGTLLVHRDITKDYEIAKMKSEFVSTVSHELRTPLASVLGFTELLLTKELKPERKTKYLQTIYNESKRLTALVNDFLDIQRMESGKQIYEKKFIDMKLILQNVIELQAINASLHNITLSIELEETIILGDKNKLKQVFMNLLSNAIKYSPEGGDILIRIYGDDQNVFIDIKDDGLGIPDEAIPNLFQKFYRVDNSDRRKIGGTGLGLAIVQEIVKAHGGKILVSSEYGKGSTFTSHFPKISLNANKENKDTSMLNSTIMIIEDDISLAELLNHELQECGFHVDIQTIGHKALEQMKKEVPDAVVLDVMLADKIDGWTIMKEMKVTEELKNIPIFISTSLEEKERGLALGAQEYLIKPYKPGHLSKLIKNTLIVDKKDHGMMV